MLNAWFSLSRPTTRYCMNPAGQEQAPVNGFAPSGVHPPFQLSVNTPPNWLSLAHRPVLRRYTSFTSRLPGWPFGDAGLGITVPIPTLLSGVATMATGVPG